MTRVIRTPVIHHVHDEFDRIGLLLGLPRLTGETNALYKRRLLDVYVHKADSSYLGLIHGITRELGLSITEVIRVQPKVDDTGSIILDNPAVIFQDTKCTLYEDYLEGDVLLEIDRFDLDSPSYTLEGLVEAINDTDYYTASLLPLAEEGARSMTIFNQSSVGITSSEDISGAGIRVVLAHRNLIPGTVSVRSDVLTHRVSSTFDMRSPGDYYVSLADGTLYSNSAPGPGSFIRYHYRIDDFVVRASPVIIHNLQSQDFKTKMFEQVEGSDGESSNGRPTALGAEIINELLSLYPTSYGT